MDEVQLKVTEDGSHTLFSPRVGECYHSQHGAVQESRHVFIDAGWRQCAGAELRVLEVGFGTGLNAFLTLLQAEREQRTVLYTALERYPLLAGVAASLNYPALLGEGTQADFLRLHTTEWEQPVRVSPHFTLLKLQADFTAVTLPGSYDLIYFDAFSPEKQPEMWTQERYSLPTARKARCGGLCRRRALRWNACRGLRASGKCCGQRSNRERKIESGEWLPVISTDGRNLLKEILLIL